MKKIFSLFILFSLLFALTSCGEDTDTQVAADGLESFRANMFAMEVPASWEKLETSAITAPIHGTVELAMRSLKNTRWFMNNLVVLSDKVETEATSSEYARQSMLWASREYLSIEPVSDEVITFTDGETSRLSVFHAKYNEVTEQRLFFQTARICGTYVFLTTLTLEDDTDPTTYDRYREILSSFQCKSWK